MRHHIKLISALLFSSCFPDKNADKDFEMKVVSDSTVSTRLIMRDKLTCTLTPTLSNISDSLMVGVWKDSIHWELIDTCWYGFEPIDLRLSLNLHKSKKFEWIETASDPKFNYKRQGKYWTYSQNDSSFLVLASNAKADTLFFHGDTMLTRRFHIYTLTNNSVRIRPLAHYGFENIIYDFKR